MTDNTRQHYKNILQGIDEEGLYKKERIITSPQKANIEVKGGMQVLNMCANNYLGLADNPTMGIWTIICPFYMRNPGDPQGT